jgi:hypothetical protein
VATTVVPTKPRTSATRSAQRQPVRRGGVGVRNIGSTLSTSVIGNIGSGVRGTREVRTRRVSSSTGSSSVFSRVACWAGLIASTSHNIGS